MPSRWYRAWPRWIRRQTSKREASTEARNLPLCGKKTRPFPHSVNNYFDDLDRILPPKWIASQWLLCSGSGSSVENFPGLASGSGVKHTQTQRSTRFHHSRRNHSSTKVFAHWRWVHQRVPNCALSCEAATENVLPCNWPRKILQARRV